MPAKKRKESANGKSDASAVQAVDTGSADGIGQPRSARNRRSPGACASLAVCARALRSPAVERVRLLATIVCLHAACGCADMRARVEAFQKRASAASQARRSGRAARWGPSGTSLGPSIVTAARTACLLLRGGVDVSI